MGVFGGHWGWMVIKESSTFVGHHLCLVQAAAQANATLTARLAHASARQQRLNEEARALAVLQRRLALDGEDLLEGIRVGVPKPQILSPKP